MPPVLVGQGLDLLVVGLLGRLAVEAHPPAAVGGIKDRTALIAAVLALSGLRALTVDVLLSPSHRLHGSAWCEAALLVEATRVYRTSAVSLGLALHIYPTLLHIVLPTAPIRP